VAFRRAAPSHRHRPCAPRPPGEPPPPPSAALGSDIENGVIHPRKHHRSSSRTPPDSVRVAGGRGALGVAWQRQRSDPSAQGGRAPQRRPATDAPASPPAGCRSAAKLRGESVQTPHCTRGVGGGLTRTLRRVASSRAGTHGGAALGAAAAALPPPSSPTDREGIDPSGHAGEGLAARRRCQLEPCMRAGPRVTVGPEK